MSSEPETIAVTSPAPKAAIAPWYRRIKPWQFSLRTMLVLMAIASGACWYYLLPKRHEEKLAGGYLILKREYRGKGVGLESLNGGTGPLVNVFHGENDGYWRLSDLQGRLLVVGNYRNGQEDGWWTTYHPNGRKAVHGKMRTGVRTGVWKTWSASGQLLSEATYGASEAAASGELPEREKPASRLQGAAKYWHENGKPSAAGKYELNLRSGPWQEWNEKGELSASGSYLQGKKHGVWQEMAEGEKKLTTSNYVHGLKKELLDAHLKSLAERLEKGDVSERLTLIGVAAEFGEPALQLFVRYAEEKSEPQVQLAAISAIGRCQGEMKPYQSSLERIAGGTDPDLPAAARWELYRSFPAVRGELLPKLLSDTERLAEFSGHEAFSRLREMFVLEPGQRQEVFDLMLKLVPEIFLGKLFEVEVIDNSTSAKTIAAWHVDVVPYLDRALSDENAKTRLSAVKLIRQLLIEHGESAPNQSPWGTYQSTWRIPPRLARLVKKAREDSDPEVKQEADGVDDNTPRGFGGGGGLF
jgi:antitoxin component YwqK of YwqJK toxin-antitoxin module